MANHLPDHVMVAPPSFTQSEFQLLAAQHPCKTLGAVSGRGLMVERVHSRTRQRLRLHLAAGTMNEDLVLPRAICLGTHRRANGGFCLGRGGMLVRSESRRQ